MGQSTSPGNGNGPDESTISNLIDLPHDVFLIIISHLSSTESILCRRVSRSWHAAFTSEDVSWNLMRWHFPRTREMRNAVETTDRSIWVRAFPEVARRYSHLRSARPRLIEKIDLVPGPGMGDASFQEVEPWSRWLRWNDNTSIFQYRDPSWGVDDGLLVYREGVAGGYVAYDLESRRRVPVPFDAPGKIVRRLRLAHGTLVIEWCEREPCHQSDDREGIHRHFVTAFDVRRSAESRLRRTPDPWEIRFRSEWKIVPTGLPVNRQDRFFSAHTATHYALYLWQHQGSPGNEQDPLEQLTIWEIGGSPSCYDALKDPTNTEKPVAPPPRPRVIKIFTGRALDHLGLRQGHTPTLREILLDDANVYIHEEEHPWLSGRQAPRWPPRHHHVRATGIPLSGTGPRWFDECCADGDIHLSFCPRAGSAARLGDDGGPGRQRQRQQQDSDDSDDGEWAGRAPCWRHEEFPYLTVSEVVDARAGVRLAARQCFVIEALSAFVPPRISSSSLLRRAAADEADEAAHEVRFEDDMWRRLLGKGRIVGDERWVVGEDRDGRSITIARF
ncbi:hypothetical protein F4802DRAFT_231090 [Xylaria palmicola]|nr:hypothetical protein F4802DRAFT_231090 [Xylaria palmicola]